MSQKPVLPNTIFKLICDSNASRVVPQNDTTYTYLCRINLKPL